MNVTWTFKLECSDRRLGDIMGEQKEIPTKWKRKMDYMNGPGRNHLFVPGPVNIPEQVLRAMNRNNEDYRSPAIPALTKTLIEDVKKIFKSTSGTPFIIPTTGTSLVIAI
ncbi:hypothetical protein C3L33_05905, partial [Rhododendron williamsianum]